MLLNTYHIFMMHLQYINTFIAFTIYKNIPEGCIFQTCCHKNLKSHKWIFVYKRNIIILSVLLMSHSYWLTVRLHVGVKLYDQLSHLGVQHPCLTWSMVPCLLTSFCSSFFLAILVLSHLILLKLFVSVAYMFFSQCMGVLNPSTESEAWIECLA
jgi:hypothetical protein